MNQNQKPVPAIAIKDLYFSWMSPHFSLHIPALEISPGESVFLYGSSGSGKTSLLNILAGIHLPQRGDVQLMGNSLATMTQRARDHFRARHMGIIFQQFNLIPYLSVLDNILLRADFNSENKDLVYENAQQLLRSLDMENKKNVKAQSLSVGQQQRVAIARALVNSPKIILADEPTSALDSANRDAFMDVLFQSAHAAGATIVFVSHDKSLGTLFNRSVDIHEFSSGLVES